MTMTQDQLARLEELRVKGQTKEGLTREEVREGIELFRTSREAAKAAAPSRAKRPKVELSDELKELANVDNLL